MKMKEEAGHEKSQGYYPSQQQYYPLQSQQAPSYGGSHGSQPSAPPFYGTFQGHSGYSQPTAPGFPRPHQQYGYQAVPGYPVIERRSDQELPRLPCCGLGNGWCLFIMGFFLASITWYAGTIMLLCMKPDPRERLGLVCCTIAAILSILGAIVGGASAAY